MATRVAFPHARGEHRTASRAIAEMQKGSQCLARTINAAFSGLSSGSKISVRGIPEPNAPFLFIGQDDVGWRAAQKMSILVLEQRQVSGP